MMWKARLAVGCAVASSAAVAVIVLSGVFDTRPAAPGAGSHSDGSFVGMASTLFAEADGSRRLSRQEQVVVSPKPEDPDHTLPKPTTKACTGRQTLSPTLFIIGFPHSGAKSLSKWMHLHPELSYGEVSMHKQYCIPGYDHTRSGAKYVAEFTTGCSTKTTFDATPYAYQMAFEDSVHCHFRGKTGLKAFEESIGAEHRFIVLLRDPVDRFNSYVGRDKHTLHHEDSLIAADEDPCYAEPLDIWLQAFPRERFLFVKSEDLYMQPQDVLDKVFDFAEVAPRRYTSQELWYVPKHAIKHRPSMQVRQQYHGAHGRRQCVERLQRLTGLEFEWPGLSLEQHGLSSSPAINHALSPGSFKHALSPGSCKKYLKPTVLFIGFGHAGSTMLSDLMEAHPELSYGRMKEHYYWCFNGPRPLETWYAEFLVPCHTKVAFDGCPMVYEIGAPQGSRSRCWGIENLRAFNLTLADPKYKFIVVIRNPVYWMHSHIPDARVLPLDDYKWNPCYADYLEPFLAVIPRERFHFVRAEDMFADAQPVMDELFKFVGVGPHFYPPKISDNKVNTHVHSTVSTQEAERFLSLPRIVECKARLERLTGMEFDWRPGH